MDLPDNVKGFLTLLGGFTMHLCCGALYMWGTINPYITSYFRWREPSDLKVETGAAVFPVMMCAVATGMPMGVKLIKKFGSARLVCYVCGASAAFCVFISSFAAAFWQFVIIYGLCFGIITGCIYYIPIYMGYLYFPKKKGIVSGVVLCGYGLASLVFGLTFFALVNPEGLNQEYDATHTYKYFQGKSLSVAQNVPGVLRQMSFYYLILLMAGASLIFPHKDQVGNKEKALKEELTEKAVTLEQKRELKIKLAEEILKEEDDVGKIEVHEDVDTDEIKEKAAQMQGNGLPISQQMEQYSDARYEGPQLQVNQPLLQKGAHDDEDFSKRGVPNVKTALTSIRFCMSILIAILSLSIGLLVNGNYKNIGKEFLDDSFLTVVGSFAAVGNGLSRPIWSSMLDKFSFKTVFSFLLVLEIFLGLTFRYSYFNGVVYLIYVFLIHTTFGGVMAMFPVVSAQLFGVKVASQIYGIYWYGFGIANFIQFGLVIGLKKKIGYEGIYYIDVIFSVACLIIIRLYKLKTDWSNYYLEMKRQGIPIPEDPNKH
ncbi:oxalate/formate antiporter (macronuclear) [Tetrahymena thermophila SB210]|uniref:Oxalate/formate antiporter n=1 Tax=Tetrahymena thermophila (strain SB210) TaxID=312017 RepID=I7M0W0_TETTS|nr:oxalate/formate antiporter [Tetrahymena thermophila SB210]EAR91039.2 oxalate/formate antiporter [Tetrahymena thermophila SB210]|eukprot:XP_001011284.2 oxalate/formate antiporter [Tetrahymena thermophila SB210]